VSDSVAGPETAEAVARPLTVRTLERVLRRRILNWRPEGEGQGTGDSLARLREDVEQALRVAGG
jgi:hypothetical protein